MLLVMAAAPQNDPEFPTCVNYIKKTLTSLEVYVGTIGFPKLLFEYSRNDLALRASRFIPLWVRVK